MDYTRYLADLRPRVIILPIHDSCFIDPNAFCHFRLREAQVESAGANMVAYRHQCLRICGILPF